jgi:uncharacterized protein YdeI (YjbR/CyaY-like superfamily)
VAPAFFETPAALRRWFKAHHASSAELWIGFYKKDSGRRGVVYKQALDEALCFGWIDGMVRRVDDASYMQRFTPRRPRSNWSAVNIAKMRALVDEGRAQPAGLAAFERRTPDRSAVHSYEQRQMAALSAAERRAVKANPTAWSFFEAQPPHYKRTVAWWIQSAKKDETRTRRLASLIDFSARGRMVPPFVQRPDKR